MQNNLNINNLILSNISYATCMEILQVYSECTIGTIYIPNGYRSKNSSVDMEFIIRAIEIKMNSEQNHKTFEEEFINWLNNKWCTFHVILKQKIIEILNKDSLLKDIVDEKRNRKTKKRIKCV